MRTKCLGRTGIVVPIVGLGTGHLGLPHQNLAVEQYSANPHWINYMDPDLAFATVTAAIDGGVRLIDTAPWYGRGASELAVHEALKARPEFRNEIALCTKIGHLYPNDDYDYSYDAAMRSFEGSQKRLGVERFLIVHLHDPMGQPMEMVMSDQGTFGAMKKLRDQGLIKFFGVGANDYEVAASYVATGEFDVAMVVSSWSLINLSAQDKLIPNARRWNTGLIAANALERGLLATGFREGIVYQERVFSQDLRQRVEDMKSLCAKYGIPLAAAALQWSVREVNFAIAIPGARTPAQVRENIAAAELAIPDAFWTELTPLIRTWDCVIP